MSISGMDAGGAVFILLFGVCALFGFLGNKSEAISGWKFWTVFGVALLSGLIGVVKISEVGEAGGKLGGGVSLGLGLIVILIGAVAVAATTFLFKKKTA